MAKGVGAGAQPLLFPQLNERFSPQLPLLFGIGVLLYMLSVALHYVLLSLESSKEAETREQEALTLAREAEMKALKAQINPHFLFNSLNSISALATVDGVRARDMCIKLSDFLRTTLSLGEKQSITLARRTGAGQGLSGGGAGAVRRAASRRNRRRMPAATTAWCRPLFLQPLVENAVKHGIAGLVDGGTIRLEAHCEKGWLQVKIENEFDPESPAAAPAWAGTAERARPAAGDVRKSGAPGHRRRPADRFVVATWSCPARQHAVAWMDRVMRTMADLSPPGSKIAHYRVVSRLGEGGMGAVYLADDTRLGRRVALKVLPPDVAADPERMHRFVQEAKLASALTHPNVAYIYEIGEDDDLWFLAMEYVEGEPLTQSHPGRPAAARRDRSPSASRWRTRWTTRTPKASCIATSSRPT